MRRAGLLLATAGLLGLAALPAAAQGDMTRGQVRSMLVTALQLDLLARECDFYMSPAQRVEIARIRKATADALELTDAQVGALRNELDGMIQKDRTRVCLEDERVYRQTLDALTQGK
ncbi:hypothetical protein [Caenispirillum bisanense]|uniref:Uncharacterized protein n=1 Tax=Caenispirillum bisanense TaxID=414052 RepID=A0A286GIJ8_9PROT|nr:hypothetical protein [Caenispirillum bisanense]SOD95363.1 hypothetical protein SAMN05421508_104315 [Caenispirillum bisanense]